MVSEPQPEVDYASSLEKGVYDSNGGRKLKVVGWYGESDPANPINWPTWEKALVVLTINFTAFVVYMASAIYTPSQPGVQSEFGVSATASSLGLGLFVVGYGTGSLFWSPVSEIPAVGRNGPYALTLVVFLILSVPTALSNSFGMLLAFRFLQGFFGSPILSTGGASLGDIADPYTKPYSLYTWAIAAFAGPSVGTIMAGFTVPRLGWRWGLWEILIVVSPALALLVKLFLPETSAPTILYRRAKLIRKLTGSDSYVARSEIESSNVTLMTWFYGYLVIPWKINLLDPSIMFTSVYSGLTYAIFLSMFEFFPMVYGDIYGMAPGEIGLVLICNIVATIVAGVPYLAFVCYKVNPSVKQGRPMSPEQRLLPAVIGSLLVPVGIFVIGWTSRPSIHWIVPTIGALLSSAGFVVILQSIFVYITLAYPTYAAALFGGNGFIKGLVACGGILWSHPLYQGLGLSKGMSVLGALCAACIVGTLILYTWGHKLRERSRFAA
ncbi:MFS domain-containing protein [Fusarium sp. LHS14.1]|nr:MFS domain-containing protein [Fusarium sp. LHS14.1]